MITSIIDYFQEGKSVAQISKLVGSYSAKVSKILKENGFETSKAPTSDQVIIVVDAVNEGKTYAEAARLAEISFQQATKICKLNGIYKRVQNEISSETRQKCIELYEEGMSSPKIAKQLGVSKFTVLESIKHLPKKKKQFYNTYTCNYSFFDNIDNEVKAYFLGLFYADGYNNEKLGAISIGFAEKDSELLYKFKEAIESNHPISLRKKDETNRQPFHSLTINNRPLSEALAKQGCTQAKTHVLDKLPEMEESLLRHFIRGYFDGDGSVWHSLVGSGNKVNLSFTGNKPFLLNVQEILVKELGIGSPTIYIRHKDRGNEIGDLRYALEPAYKVLEWLYNDCQYYSERKKTISLKHKFEEDLIQNH
jgi:intein/homing endonuclease